jgi:hypothetical protein
LSCPPSPVAVEQAFAPSEIPACSVSALKFSRQITAPTVHNGQPRAFFIWHARSLKNGDMEMLDFLRTFEVVFVREPSLLPVFGKLGVKAPAVTAAAPTMSKGLKSMASSMREVLSSHGGLALKLSVVVWTILVLAAVFFITKA